MTMLHRVRVMHMIDTLQAGGAERVAVNLANHLPRDRYQAFLCTTREDGPLAGCVESYVGRVRLARKGRFDITAIRTLARFLRENEIQIVHAHSSSLFIAALAAGYRNHTRVIWHDHYGKVIENRSAMPYRMATTRISGVIAVSDALAAWSRSYLRIPDRLVWHIPNFAEFSSAGAFPELPGRRGSRIVHVANLRPQKDHPTLLRAFLSVAQRVPDAHLLLVGATVDPVYSDAVAAQVRREGLERRVTVLGPRSDVPDILAQCDIGVLSSIGEGMPLSLIEYGMAGLPAIATAVGQCPEVLDRGEAGILVPPGDAPALAGALFGLLRNAERRSALGSGLRRRVTQYYSAGAVVRQICEVYDAVLRN